MSLSTSHICLIILITSSIGADQPPRINNAALSPSCVPKSGQPAVHHEEETLDDVLYFDDVIVENERPKKDAKVWDHWGKWSPCSVSCGVGKMTRWRHCISKACASGDKEAQIKTCTLPPC